MATIPQQLARQSILVVEATIPPGMTIDQWRRGRVSAPRRRARRLQRKPYRLPGTKGD